MMHLRPRKLQAFNDALHLSNSCVMKQYAKPKVGGRSTLQKFQGLFDVGRPLEFRQDLCAQSGFFKHSYPARSLAFHQNSRQLISNTFAGDLVDLGRHCQDRIPSLLLDRVAQPRAETDGSENSQFVFFESRARIADGANDFCIDIGAAIDVINDFIRKRVIQQAVDRKISSQYVLLRVGENHAAQVSTVDISFIGTKGCNLKWMAALDYQYNPKLRTNRFGSRKNSGDLFRISTCSNVVINRLDFHHHVTDTAAHKVSLMTMDP